MSRVWRRVVEPEQREQRRATTAPRRTEAPPRTAAGTQREVTGGNERGTQALERRRALSPLEDDLTYAEVTSGRRSSSPRIMPRSEEANRTPATERESDTQRKEAPWEEVRWKKQRSSPVTGETARPERIRANYYTSRRSPPTKRTSSGVVEVCGKCRQPGHHAIDCRRIEVCRRCERPGHREATCPVPSSELSTPQVNKDDLLKKKGKKRKAKNEASPGEGSGLGKTQAEEMTARQAVETEKTTSHRGSIAIDEDTVEEIRRLRSYTISTVTKGYAGSVPSRRVKEEVAALVGQELEWSSEPFEDDRILLHCPSTELARKLENMCELKFKTFSICCHPCTATANSTGTAEGQLRWLNIKGLPVFGRRLDMIARLLKPTALVYTPRDGPIRWASRAAAKSRH
ncbi:hypothetical protein J5N97_011417 [Dioscorea zingiberensis]|uniref:CCHC-type domain-containing protein n=1 Tax=Dioscorea zingiberensis TaxID=325984 RepID=A0A9D5HPJ8_9LILI|nr:hypothetical protein J5N97_011417 [Dioscorea zingiberensis]